MSESEWLRISQEYQDQVDQLTEQLASTRDENKRLRAAAWDVVDASTLSATVDAIEHLRTSLQPTQDTEAS